MADARPWQDGEILTGSDLRKEFALNTETQMFILWELASQNPFPITTVENTGFSLEVGSLGSTIDSGSSFNFETTNWQSGGGELEDRLVFVESYDEFDDSSIDGTLWSIASALGSVTETSSQLVIGPTVSNTANSFPIITNTVLGSGTAGIDYKTVGSDSEILINVHWVADIDGAGGGTEARCFIEFFDTSTSVILGSIGGAGAVVSVDRTDSILIKNDLSAGSAYIYDYSTHSPLTLGTPGSVNLNSLGSWYIRFRTITDGEGGVADADTTMEVDYVRMNQGNQLASFNFTTIIQDKKSNAQTGFGYRLGGEIETSSIAMSNDAGVSFTLLDAPGSFVDFGTTGSQIKVRITGSLNKVSDPTVGSVNLPSLTHWGMYAFRL